MLTENKDLPDLSHRADQFADTVAPLMFYASIVFLILVAAIIVIWIDVPRVEWDERSEAGSMESVEIVLSESEQRFEMMAFRAGSIANVLLFLLWPFFIVEQVMHFALSARGDSFSRKHPFWWVYVLVPPLRMCARHRSKEQYIWLPKIGWQEVDRNLQRRLERAFSVPMIWIAMLILPVLGLQLVFKERIVEYSMLRFVLHVGTGLIWFAFATEFIVMVSVTDKKWNYCKKNWLDLVIILLPLVSFLRTLRIVRSARLLQVGKLQQLSRVIRVYRLRGVSMRALRALLLLELVHRLLRTKPEKRIAQLEQTYHEKKLELDDLLQEINELRAKHGLPHNEKSTWDAADGVDEMSAST